MKVKELIDKLQTFSPELEVVLNEATTQIRIEVGKGNNGEMDPKTGEPVMIDFLYIDDGVSNVKA